MQFAAIKIINKRAKLPIRAYHSTFQLHQSEVASVNTTAHSKHVIITGCDSGIGKSLVTALSKKGYRLTLGVLNVEHKQELENIDGDINVHQLDLTNLSNVREFVSNIKDCHILINNAGVMIGNVRKVNGIEETMVTNYLGHFYLTNLLLPVLKQTSIKDSFECRIVHVGSSLESKAMAFPGEDPTGKSPLRGELPDSVQFKDRVSSADTSFGILSGVGWMREGPQPYFAHTAFANASLCILLSSYYLAKQLPPLINAKDTNDNKTPQITVNTVCPGYVNTALWKDSMFWNLVRRIAFKKPEAAAEFIADIATSTEYSGSTGKFFTAIADTEVSKAALNEDLSHSVWEESISLVDQLLPEGVERLVK